MARWMTMLLTAAAITAPLSAERIKDIVDIKGVRGNPIEGIGLVIGLTATGDSSKLAQQMLASYIRKKGIVLNPEDLTGKNVAAVTVKARLGPWNRRGSKIDVTVSAIGDASSLQNGELLMTELTGMDGEVYAVAEGQVLLGGFSVKGQSATIVKNHTTVGRIPSGATVEREELAEIIERDRITLLLRNADHTTAMRIAEAVGKMYPASIKSVDPGSIAVLLPAAIDKTNVSSFIDKIGALEVETEMPATVMIDERTGTIVVGENVRISKVAITHGSLTIITEELQEVSQPSPLSRTGQTAVVNRTQQQALEAKGELHLLNATNVADLARALNAMGLTPRELISIFQMLKAKGALQGQLKVM